jgi:hypothetical protein
MVVLAVEFFTVWFMAAVLAGFSLGALIQRAERQHKDEFLAALFSTLSREQAYR